MLDLYCGGGLAAAGYWRSGCFSEIVGVDMDSSMGKAYPFDFVCADTLALDYDFLLGFDFIHASPPCQYYSAITPRYARSRHRRLIPGTHLMLVATGKPYVIENVPGSSQDLRPNLILSGADCGLPHHRPRYFHISHAVEAQISRSAIVQIHQPDFQMSSAGAIHGASYVSRDSLIHAFGLRELPGSHLSKLTRSHIEQGIPPEMTRRIALALFPKLMLGAA